MRAHLKTSQLAGTGLPILPACDFLRGSALAEVAYAKVERFAARRVLPHRIVAGHVARTQCISQQEEPSLTLHAAAKISHV